MTISSTVRKAGPFTGDGIVVTFPFTFKVFAASDLLVVQTTAGVDIVKALASDYTVTLNADQSASPGGSLTMSVPPPVGSTLLVSSQVDNTQNTDLTNLGGFYPKVINDALDKATIQIQQLAGKISRALLLPISSLANGVLSSDSARASKFLAFDGDGNPVVSSGTGADAGLRADLAASGGAALVGQGATTVDVSIGQSGAANSRRSLTAPRPRMLPTSAFTQALAAGVVRVTVVGDSISEAADIHYANSYVALLTEMLSEQMPTIQWVVSNISIAGMSAENLADPTFVGGDGTGNTFNRPAGLPKAEAAGLNSWTRDGLWTNGSTVGVSWRDHVNNLTPDLVIVAHGQNSVDEVSFATAMQSFIAYTQTWTKVPWLALVATHLPTTAIDPWSTADRQMLIQAIADSTRAIAVRNGYGLIDANSAWRILRDGVQPDYTKQTFEQNFRFWGDATKWSVIGTAPTLAANVLSSTATSIAMRTVLARDVDISARFVLVSANAYPKIVLRSGATDLSGITLQMVGSDVAVFARTTGLLTAPMGFTPALGDTVRMRVKCTGRLLKVWVNDTLLIERSDLALLMTAGFHGVGWAGGYGNVSDYEANYAEAETTAQPYYTQALLLGSVPFGDPTNLDSPGGNAINHPTNLGSHLAYAPAVAQFVRELQARVDHWISGRSLAYTPTFGVLDGAAFTMLTQTGQYARNGAVVTVQGTVKLSASAAPGGAVVVGLPFVAAGNQTLSVGFASGISGAAGFTALGMTTIGGTTSALLRVLNPQAGTWGEVTALTSTAWLEFGGTYVAA